MQVIRTVVDVVGPHSKLALKRWAFRHTRRLFPAAMSAANPNMSLPLGSWVRVFKIHRKLAQGRWVNRHVRRKPHVVAGRHERCKPHVALGIVGGGLFVGLIGYGQSSCLEGA